MRTVDWGLRQVDMLEYQYLVEWASTTERYRDLPPLGQLPIEQAPLEERPILGDLKAAEQAYIRAHWERRHMFRATMDVMALGLWELDQTQVGEEAGETPASPQGDGPDLSDPAFMRRMHEYRSSTRFDRDYRRRILGRTRTWLGFGHEPYLLTPTQPYLYARAGALAIRSSFGRQKFTGNAVWDLMSLGGLRPSDINAVQKLLVDHGVIEYCEEGSFDSSEPNLISSPMQIVPEKLDHLEGQGFYNVPTQDIQR